MGGSRTCARQAARIERVKKERIAGIAIDDCKILDFLFKKERRKEKAELDAEPATQKNERHCRDG